MRQQSWTFACLPFANEGNPRSDNGPEFVAEAIQAWITAVGAKTAYIERGSPWENGYIESFNARLRDELLNGEIFYTLREAQIVVESWRRHYSSIRPHASLGYKPPAPEVFVTTFAAWPAASYQPRRWQPGKLPMPPGIRCRMGFPLPATFPTKRTEETIHMKAIVVTDQAAGTAGMKLVERPEPPAAINDVIVQIHASGFVPTELAWPSTWTDRRDRDRTPSIPGHELAGVVTALGYGTTGLSVGQRVFGLADWHRDGTLAEYVAIEARNLAPLPGDVDFTVGASLPISGLTAWQGLF